MEIIPNWHPIFVHFTIALYVVATLLFLLGAILPSKMWADKITTAAYINLWSAAVLTLATVAAGFYAYYAVGHDGPSHIAMTDHKNWALATAVIFWLLSLYSVSLFRRSAKPPMLFLVCLVVGTGLLGITGFKGGEVVYRHGIGVLSLPEVESEGHNHNHNINNPGEEDDKHSHETGGTAEESHSHADEINVPEEEVHVHNHEMNDQEEIKSPKASPSGEETEEHQDDGHSH